jgi:hypothetical protein
MIPGPDWNADTDTLVAASQAAIGRFALEHAEETVCFFGFDSDPRRGYVTIAIDTLDNSLAMAQEAERFVSDRRHHVLADPHGWRVARRVLSSPRLGVFTTHPDEFKYARYARVEFPTWAAAAETGIGGAHVEGYLDGNARLVLWRAGERLVESDAFVPLRLAAPFMIGYAVRDGEESILRILKWPSAAGGGA